MSRTWIIVAMLLASLVTNVFGEEEFEVCPQSTEMAKKLKWLEDTATMRKIAGAMDIIAGGIMDGIGGLPPPAGSAGKAGKAFATTAQGLKDLADGKETVPGKDVVNCMDYYFNMTNKKLDGLKQDIHVLQEQGIKTKEELMAKIKEDGDKTRQEIAILYELTKDGFEQVEKNFKELKKNVAEIKQTLKDEVLPAISELHNLVAEKFEAVSKQLESVVNEIQAYHTTTFWREKILAPLNTLQISFVRLLSKRFSRGALKTTIRRCNENDPLTIVQKIWVVAGPGCNGNYSSSMVQERGGVIPDICMALIYANRSNFEHAAIVHVYRVITNSIFRATIFHHLCLGIRTNDTDEIDSEIGEFDDHVSQINDQLPKTIFEVADMYWPKIAEDSIVPLIAKYPWNETAQWNVTSIFQEEMAAKTYWSGPVRKIYDLLNHRYFLYRHQVFAAYTSVDSRSSYATKPPNQTLTVVLKSRDILEFPSKLKSCMWADQEGWNQWCLARIFVSRYRYATQEDKDNVNKRKTNFDKWLKRNASCDCPYLHDFPERNASCDVPEFYDHYSRCNSPLDVECCLREKIYRPDWFPQFNEQQFNEWAQLNGGLTKDDRYQNYVILRVVEERIKVDNMDIKVNNALMVHSADWYNHTRKPPYVPETDCQNSSCHFKLDPTELFKGPRENWHGKGFQNALVLAI